MPSVAVAPALSWDYRAARPVRAVFIENDDSFSNNVIDLLPLEVHVVSSRAPNVREIVSEAEALIIGPGPLDPLRAGLVPLVSLAAARRIPTLGICLGHQALGLAFGATLRRSPPAHGKRAIAHISTSARFPSGAFEVMRYHSLSLTNVGAPLRVVATLNDGTVMAVEHETLPLAGLQFHPDSYGTPEGRRLVESFFRSLAS